MRTAAAAVFCQWYTGPLSVHSLLPKHVRTEYFSTMIEISVCQSDWLHTELPGWSAVMLNNSNRVNKHMMTSCECEWTIVLSKVSLGLEPVCGTHRTSEVKKIIWGQNDTLRQRGVHSLVTQSMINAWRTCTRRSGVSRLLIVLSPTTKCLKLQTQKACSGIKKKTAQTP